MGRLPPLSTCRAPCGAWAEGEEESSASAGAQPRLKAAAAAIPRVMVRDFIMFRPCWLRAASWRPGLCWGLGGPPALDGPAHGGTSDFRDPERRDADAT